MIHLTDDAKVKFDDYLQRLRASLRGTRSRFEVEENVREHVEAALVGVPAPVGTEQLLPVLDQLGPPEAWLSDAERPSWQRMLRHMQHGPEDWRLPYLTAGATALTLLLLPLGVGVLLLPIAFILGRASIDLAADRGEPLGARRWLVIPPIAICLACVFVPALIGPVVPLAVWGIGDGGFHSMMNLRAEDQSLPERIRIEVGYLAVAGGVWWIVLSGLVALLIHPIGTLFTPLTASLRRVHALLLTLAGALLLGVGGVLLLVL
jgi:hypothetical protein